MNYYACKHASVLLTGGFFNESGGIAAACDMRV